MEVGEFVNWSRKLSVIKRLCMIDNMHSDLIQHWSSQSSVTSDRSEEKTFPGFG